MNIFLDLDGPVLDGKLRHYNCYADIIKKYDGCPLDVDTYWSYKRKMIKRDKMLSESRFYLNYAVFLSEWLENIEKVNYLEYDQLKPRIHETLGIWKQEYGFKVVLVTMRRNRDHLMKQLNWLEVFHLFDDVIDCNPLLLDSKFSALRDYPTEKSMFVGDTEADVYAARKLNIPIVGVLNGIREKQYLHADYFVNEIEEIDFKKYQL